MKTRQDLIAATLFLLNALAAGQTPDAEDSQAIDALINGKIAELNRQNIYFSSDTDRFEDEYIDPLATILANMAAPAFGQPRKPDSEGEAMQRILAMRPSDRVSSNVTPSLYY